MKRPHFVPKIGVTNYIRPWVVLALIVILIGFCILGLVVALRKLTPPPTYKSTGPQNYVETPSPSIFGDVEVPPAGPKALLKGATWIPQTFNNCGPATTSMILQYFGHTVGQDQTKAHLRTNPTDTNVFTYEIQEYLKSQYDIDSKLFYNGDLQKIKLLIANGFYVMVEDWLHPNEDIGHVTILKGYDDEQGVFIADDSFIGVNIVYKYEEFETTQWKAFNREYLPVYKSEMEPVLKKIIGQDWDRETMYEKAIEKATQEIRQNDRDMYAYFNLGTSYYALGQYQNAYNAFEKSRELGWPRRMLWYQIEPIQTLNELAKFDEALRLIDPVLAGNASFAELHYEKARAYKGLGQTEKARSEAQTALIHTPNYQKAKDLLSTL
ncbi:MAG: C39 family peptidase [bacterium]|nr:C39 family peptidase [bacterium]